MPFLPADAASVVTLALILGGTGFIVASKWPKAYSLAIVILVVALAQVAVPDVTPTLGLETATFLAGAWWQPLTYMYLHAGLLHIVGNLFILVAAGPTLEDRVGSRNFLVVYFLAGFAAAAAHVALTLAHVIPGGLAIGASGAIFGVLTAFAVRYPRERLPTPLPGIGFIVVLPAFVILLLHLGLNLAVMWNSLTGRNTGIAWHGHFAGYLVGLVAGVTFEKRNVTAHGPVRAMPDVEALRPLAKDAKMTDMLDKAARFTGKDEHDAEFASAWVDKFLARATCPNDGSPLAREGDTARCANGDYVLAFGPRS